jgi:hypothetical protein
MHFGLTLPGFTLFMHVSVLNAHLCPVSTVHISLYKLALPLDSKGKIKATTPATKNNAPDTNMGTEVYSTGEKESDYGSIRSDGKTHRKVRIQGNNWRHDAKNTVRR